MNVALRSDRVRREVVGWTVVAVVSLLALIVALHASGIPDVIGRRRSEKRTAQFCSERRQAREKQSRGRRR